MIKYTYKTEGIINIDLALISLLQNKGLVPSILWPQPLFENLQYVILEKMCITRYILYAVVQPKNTEILLTSYIAQH